MVIKRFTYLAVIGLVACLYANAWAYLTAMPVPLPQAIDEAKVIVVARLEKFSPDPNSSNEQRESSLSMVTLKPSGLYNFQVLQTLKGQPEAALQLYLPRILSINYDTRNVRIEQGSKFVILLKPDWTGQLAPVDPNTPLIPLSDLARTDNKTNESVQSQIVTLILASLNDPAMRHVELCMLRSLVDPRIPIMMTAYLADPNSHIQDLALCCMAANQQISAIPQIARLERQLLPEQNTVGSSAQSLVALRYFKTSKAVPLLNPLLFETAIFTRVNTMMALVELTDRSSIPYFMLALRDPDRDVSYDAYGMLHRLIPQLPYSQDQSLFKIQLLTASRPFYQWWKDELMGKHLQGLSAVKEIPEPRAQIATLPVEELNPLLFTPVAVTRQRAIAALETRAAQSSIPYLVLALIDPDTSVSYSAYVTLHRLIPDLGTPKNRKEFTDDPESASQPIYKWWKDELAERHVKRVYGGLKSTSTRRALQTTQNGVVLTPAI